MSPLPLGVVAASGGGFVASGGTYTVDANGYRHHIFNSSGTFTVASGESPIYVLTQSGGQSSTGPFFNGGDWTWWAGNGGNAGEVSYLQGTVNQNLTVTVGGAASASTVSGVTLSSWLNSSVATGGVGGNSYRSPSSGTDGVNHSSMSPIYSSVSNMNSLAGGGGGGGAVTGQSAGSGGNSGGGNGGNPSQYGNPGGTNTGGGGGGNGEGYYGTQPGGSGYVVISYAL